MPAIVVPYTGAGPARLTISCLLLDLFCCGRQSQPYAVEGAAPVALCAAVVWGILSIIFSPCQRASISVIVGSITAQDRVSTGRAFSAAALLSLGMGTVVWLHLTEWHPHAHGH